MKGNDMQATITREQAASDRRAALGGTSGPPVEAMSHQPRSLAFPAQLRASLVQRNGQELFHVSGIASVTNKPYEMYDFFGSYMETIDHKAFDETLAANPDVAFLVNHRGVTMARTTNGTLSLGMVDAGLGSNAWLNPKRQDVADLVIAIEDRNIDQMSFAFMLEEGLWNQDMTEFTITKVNIDRGDVSAVNYGANPFTSITARSREILDDIDHLPVGVARAAMARLSSRKDIQQVRALPGDVSMLTQAMAWFTSVDSIVDEAQEALATYLGVPSPDPDDMPDVGALSASSLDLARVSAWLTQNA